MPSGPGDPFQGRNCPCSRFSGSISSWPGARYVAPQDSRPPTIIVLGKGIASATVMFALVQGVLLRCARCLVASSSRSYTRQCSPRAMLATASKMASLLRVHRSRSTAQRRSIAHAHLARHCATTQDVNRYSHSAESYHRHTCARDDAPGPQTSRAWWATPAPQVRARWLADRRSPPNSVLRSSVPP
jgi:hypothetical protein